MDFETLLKGDKNCACGMEHKCDIARVEIYPGALETLPAICENAGHILLVADVNTYPLCGKSVRGLLGGKLKSAHVFERSGVLVPDEESISELESCLSVDTDMLVGIGSGVINDLCKYVSFKHGLRYVIIASAPSMDGYASNGAALILHKMKITLPCAVPYAIIGDTDILKTAPPDMIRSGYGDIIGKYSALCDWKLSAVVDGEYWCDNIYRLVKTCLERVVSLDARALLNKEPAALAELTGALVTTGIALSFVGNSRPASGSEHHLSHFFEITGLVFDKPYYLHGIDVAYSTVVTAKLRERLLAENGFPDKLPPFDEAAWESKIRRVYGSASGGVLELQKKLGWYGEARYPVYREKWKEIREALSMCPTPAEIERQLSAVGLDYGAFLEYYGREKIIDAVYYAKDLKDRYTVLWLYDALYSNDFKDML